MFDQEKKAEALAECARMRERNYKRGTKHKHFIITCSFNLPVKLKREIDDYCETNDLEFSEYIRFCVRFYLELKKLQSI